MNFVFLFLFVLFVCSIAITYVFVKKDLEHNKEITKFYDEIEKEQEDIRNRYTNGYYVHAKKCPCCKTNFNKDGSYTCVY